MTSYPLRGFRLINNRIFPDMILHPSPELDVVSKRYLYILMLDVRTMAELPTFLATFGLDVDIEVRRPRQYTVIIIIKLKTRARDNDEGLVFPPSSGVPFCATGTLDCRQRFHRLRNSSEVVGILSFQIS